jgi:plastocyanin
LKRVLALAAILAAAACRLDKTGTGPDEGTVLVDIRETGFSPDTVRVVVGKYVRWTNRGNQAHAISSPTFTSQNLFPTWWFEARFDAAGTYDYFCSLHAEKEGTVIAE